MGLFAAAAATLVLALPVSAATVTVSAVNSSNVFKNTAGLNGWYQTTSYTLGGIARTAATGLFRLKAVASSGAVTNFVAVCLEPIETLRLPTAYSEGTPLAPSVITRLAALLHNALPLVKDSRTAAAFQLAAWEIANEGQGMLNLGAGQFRLTQSDWRTSALAQQWLNLISSNGWQSKGRITILQAPRTQDLLTDLPAEVPVPAAGLLLIGGLGGLAALRRNRRGGAV